ncbi:hypothetical protein O3M35_010682 [Rhynocoris fuscipes]|uniref:Uncharacterized protein n=1 Tax=Rhynocoris fuscipes TaxID=488301 RepID=A0AAW1D259_9HEMI
MAQSHHVLSKAQEQLNYATTRCGSLMEQLGRIKSHINWKEQDKENVNEQNSEEESRKDSSNNKSKITAYKKESTENYVADIVQEKSNEKNELYAEERVLSIKSPGSSCFESLISENSSSVSTGSLFSSGEELDDEIVEVNEIKEDKEKYEIPAIEASKEKVRDNSEEEYSEEVDDDDDDYDYETEEEEILDHLSQDDKINISQLYRNVEEKHDKNYEEINAHYETAFSEVKELDISSVSSEILNEKRMEESDSSSGYTTTDLEDEEEISKAETNKNYEKADLIEKESKEELQKITSPPKVNLFTEELTTEFISVTHDLDKDIEIIEINANDFNQNENDSTEKQLESIKSNIDNLTEKENNKNENNRTAQTEKKDISNKTTTKFNSTIKKFEKRESSLMETDEIVNGFNKNINLNQETNSITVKLDNVGSEKKQKGQKKAVTFENKEAKDRNATLVTNSKLKKENQSESLAKVENDTKEQIGKRIVGKTDEPKLANKENIKVPEKKPTVNVSSRENKTKPLNVFERLSLNTQKKEDVSNKSVKNIKSIGQIKNSKNDLKKINHNEKLLKATSNISNILYSENKLERSNVPKSEAVISKSLFERIQKTIGQNSESKYDNMLTENEHMTNEKSMTVNQVISKSSEEKKESKGTNTPSSANKAIKPWTSSQLLKINKPLYDSELAIKSAKDNTNEKMELDNEVDNTKFISSDFSTDLKEEAVQVNAVSENNCININKHKLSRAESEKTFTLLRTQQISRIPKSRKKSNFKYKSWEENSEMNSMKTIANHNKATLPHFGSAANINLMNSYNRYSNTKIANSLGFNTIPFIVGKSTSKSFHIGLNIQQTLSLINLSPSVPTLKISEENKQAIDFEKQSSLSSVSAATYKPKSCPACTAIDIKDEDEDLIPEDPWHVPQKDAWDSQNIASKKKTRCTCLPANIISFNEVLSQMFQAEGLMPSRPRSSTNVSCETRQDYGKTYQENKKLIVRPNNSTYLTRLLRNIQRIQDQYIVPIAKLSVNGFKYNTT